MLQTDCHCCDKETPSLPTFKVNAVMLGIGEVIRKGDYWHYKAIDSWVAYHEAPKNFFGLPKKINKHHSPIARVFITLQK